MLMSRFDVKVHLVHCVPPNDTNDREEEVGWRLHGTEVLGANLEEGSPPTTAAQYAPHQRYSGKTSERKPPRSMDLISQGNSKPVGLLPGKRSPAQVRGDWLSVSTNGAAGTGARTTAHNPAGLPLSSIGGEKGKFT